MSVRVIDFQAKVCGDTKDVTMHNFIERNLTFKLVNNPLTLMEIPDAEKTMLPTLKEMYPEWFSPKKYFDRIDAVVVEGQPKSSRTEEEEAYMSGYMAALELMQEEMNRIEEKL